MADLGTILQNIDQYLDIQLHVCDINDPYDRGLYNGIELARSVITGEEPVFVDRHKKLDQEAIDRNPQRYI